MSFVMTRSFAEALGIRWPDNAAQVVGDHRGHRVVTWDELLARRREQQASRLASIRRPAEPTVLPCYVWTFFNSSWIYHGWHCYVVTRHFDFPVNFRGFREELAISIMQACPLGLFPVEENFDKWMKELAKQHPRRKPRKDPRKAGSVIGWLEHRRRFTLHRPK
jgi:hypothetical protein